MSAVVLRADARALPLPDASVDLIVTSPPYYGLRDYRDGDGSLAGQIGSEATPAAYVAALLDCTREWMRVLKPSGSLFVNLGDKYAGNNQDGRSRMDPNARAPGIGGGMSAKWRQPKVIPVTQDGARHKSLLGMPWRYALGCIDDLGLILRAEIIWAKPNGLPESVTDRVRRSHEQVFHFTRQPRYYSAVDEVREAQQSVITASGAVRYRRPGESIEPYAKAVTDASRYAATARPHEMSGGMTGAVLNPLGKLPGSVWEIPSQPLTVPAALGVDHFAAFPMELPRRIIAGWSPPGICVACGEGRRPVSVSLRDVNGEKNVKRVAAAAGAITGGTRRSTLGDAKHAPSAAITGYACACPQPDAPTRPAIVVDPFSGTGTTALVASVLGRTGIGTDRSADYCRLARWRVTDPGERARALQVPKPPPQLDGQGDLFTMDAS